MLVWWMVGVKGSWKVVLWVDYEAGVTVVVRVYSMVVLTVDCVADKMVAKSADLMAVEKVDFSAVELAPLMVFLWDETWVDLLVDQSAKT